MKTFGKTFGSGWIAGLVTATSLSLAFGAVPRKSQVTDDTAIYQRLSEIRVPRVNSPDFDTDLRRLSGMEKRYQERLPALSRRLKNPRLRQPIHRISQQRYQYSPTH